MWEFGLAVKTLLGIPWHIGVTGFGSRLWSVFQLLADAYQGKLHLMAEEMHLFHSCGRPGWSSELLALECPNPAVVGVWGSELAFCLLVFLCLSAFSINEKSRF